MSKSSPAPSQIWIALPFFLFGFLHFAGALIWLAIDPGLLTGGFYRPPVIAFAHFIGLGFLMSLVVGSSYQLLPVAFENPLFSRSAAKIHLALHIPGVPTMVIGFAYWKIPVVAAGATAVLLGLALYVLNISATALRPLRRTPTSIGVLACLGSLVVALGVATWILAVKLGFLVPSDPLLALGAHTYLILFGFFLLILAAVSFTLLPMFLLVPLASHQRAYGAVYYFIAGIALFLPGQLALHALLPFAALAVIIGLSLYVLENASLIRRSPRKLDGALRLYAANLFFVLPVAAGLLLRSLQIAGHVPVFRINLDTPLFVFAVFGVLASAILGMGAKIVPFLVWQQCYAPLLGRALVPRLADLVHGRLLNILAWTVPAAGLVLGCGSVLGSSLMVRLGALLLCVSMAGFVANLFKVLTHLWRPASRPFPSPAVRPAGISK